MSNPSCQLTILFADIGSSTDLYDRVGDTEAYALIAQSLAHMKQAVAANGGKVLRTVGDSVLASFENADQAFLSARAMQDAHTALPLAVRVGFHTGSVIPDGGDVYGHAVNIAARVAAFARVDEIMATEEAVRQLSIEHQSYASCGHAIDVRGVPDPVKVHRLRWQEHASAVTQLAAGFQLRPSEQASLRLSVTYGSSQWFLGPGQSDITLGRSSENDIAVSNKEASRHHAQIRYRHGQFILHDESTNGTYVQKHTLIPFLVRRDSIVLDGQGVMCLGAQPDLEGDSELIKFELVQS